MADVKISQLPSASTPLAGTEVLPIVQGGVTSKVAISDVTAGRAVSMTSITVADGSASTPSITNDGDTNTGIFFPAADTIAFAEGGVEAMRLDSSGNLGLGVTPSAWASNWKVFELGYGSFNANAGGIGIYGNAYNNTSNVATYKANGFASSYQTYDGGHYWSTAPSGTAGNAITFTQAMTLDASGLLALGTTSPASATRLTLDYPGFVQMVMRSSGTDRISLYGDAAVSAVDAKANPLAFSAGSAERARITSGGDFLVGTTSSGLKTNRSMGFQVAGGCTQFISHSTSDASGDSYVEFGYNGTKIGSITQSGTTAVLYNVTSDQRLKENIVDAPEFGNVIDSIQVRSYDWKTDQTHQRAGFVAQELVTVAPEAVHQPVDPDDMMAVDYSKLVPMLVKEIQSLRKRLTALEQK